MEITIGDKVTRKDPTDKTRGEVVEIAEDGRIRVLWEGDPQSYYSAHRPKRTWLRASALIRLEKEI